MVAMALRDLGDHVNFSYYPVHNWNSTGGYMCSYNESGVVHTTDCESTRYDGCMVAHYCWKPPGCDHTTQMKIARFLRCFEGAYSNTEVPTNASRREPCFREAGLDFAPVQQCYDSTPLVDSIESRLNVSKGAMMASLGSNPGTFPHIFLDGEHQWNYSWCALTRTLCGKLKGERPAACKPILLSLTFALSPTILPAVTAVGVLKLETVVEAAVDVATSAAALPDNFDKADPKYVDVKAVGGSSTPRLSSRIVTIEVEVLKAFVDEALRGVPSKRFREALAEGLQGAGVAKATAEDITDVKIAHASLEILV